jgi:Family of unknown function (DUF5989)
MDEHDKKPFEQAGAEDQPSLLSEFWHMLKHNKKFWLIPLIVGLLLFGLLIILGGSAAAPFIYTLF